jgi:hypothetical protein
VEQRRPFSFAAMTFRYRLIDEHGADLGPLASQRVDWQPGERLSRRHGETLEVLRVVDVDEAHAELFRAYIVVRPSG